MARPLRIELAHAFYHVISRGNERKAIFKDASDYDIFLGAFEEACDYYNVFVHSYCLMPNHIHLLLETPEANLSLFMKRLLGVYTIRFNRKYKRHGHLFQGRYKALLVEKDSYLLPLSRYIHLNPIKAKLCTTLEYRYSSLRFFTKNNPPCYLKTEILLGLFASRQKYLEYVKEGVDKDEFLPKVTGGIAFGGEDFFNTLKEKILKKSLDNVAFTNSFTGCDPKKLEPFIQQEPKPFKIYCLRMLSKLPQKQIGDRFNLSFSAVSKIIKRFESKIKENGPMQKKFNNLKIEMSNFKN